eukprot:m.85409 g.85409  ORF g.85409 m.85409 type:complete len:319 (+) comp13010_c0_seq1:95-1051(+)
MPLGQAGSTPVRRSARSTAGKSPARLGYNDGWENASSKWTSDSPAVGKSEDESETESESESESENEQPVSLSKKTKVPKTKPGNEKKTTENCIEAASPVVLSTAMAFMAFTYGSSEKEILPTYTRTLLKAAPMFAMLVSTLTCQTTRSPKLLLVFAFLFSMIGDIVLDVHDISPAEYSHLFLAGAAAFAVAHVMYILCFLIHFKSPFALLSHIVFVIDLVGSPVLISAVKDAANQSSVADENEVMGILIYGIVISTMVACASYAQLPTRAIIGAILFALSDTILGFNRYGKDITNGNASVCIMTTYYLGQYLIASSLA